MPVSRWTYVACIGQWAGNRFVQSCCAGRRDEHGQQQYEHSTDGASGLASHLACNRRAAEGFFYASAQAWGSVLSIDAWGYPIFFVQIRNGGALTCSK